MAEGGYFFEDLAVGMSSTYTSTVTTGDIQSFAEVSSDKNPLHLDEEYASSTMFKGCIAHGMLSASYFSTILGTRLPGPGAIYLFQSLKFKAPVRPGETAEAYAEITGFDERRKRATFKCECKVGDTVVVSGEAIVMVPSRSSKD